MAWIVRVRTNDAGMSMRPGQQGMMVSRKDSRQDAIIEAAELLGFPAAMLEAEEYHIEGFRVGQRADEE